MSIAIGVKVLGVFVSDKTWVVLRRVTLHSSCLGFSLDFIHSVVGNVMIFARVFEVHHEVIITWSALAAVLVVYIDDRFHNKKEVHHKDDEGAWNPALVDPVQ